MYVAEGRPCEKLEPEQTFQEGLFSVEASSWSQGPGQQGSRCGTLVSPQALLFQAFISESFFDVHQSPSLCSGSIEVFLALTDLLALVQIRLPRALGISAPQPLSLIEEATCQ